MDDPAKTPDGTDSLEQSTTVVQPSAAVPASGGVAVTAPAAPPPPAPAGRQPHPRGILRRLIGRINVYLLLFVFLLVIAGVAGILLYLKAQTNNQAANQLGSQSLSQSTLDQLSNTDVSVGEPKHTLNVQSNAVFAGSVLVRSNLQIAGTLQVGSNLAINGIRVTGSSTFDDVQITKSLALTGNAAIQGQLNVGQSLHVNGGATFLGAVAAPSLAVTTLQLSGNLNITHHIAAGGSTPGRTSGTALGGGGTATVSGSDTAGSVTISTGSNPAPGCFLTVAFTTKFATTPHIVATPVGQAAAALQYYISRSTSSFSICTTNAAASGSTFGFDYIAFD